MVVLVVLAIFHSFFKFPKNNLMFHGPPLPPTGCWKFNTTRHDTVIVCFWEEAYRYIYLYVF